MRTDREREYALSTRCPACGCTLGRHQRKCKHHRADGLPNIVRDPSVPLNTLKPTWKRPDIIRAAGRR